MERFDAIIGAWLARWVRGVCRRARPVAWLLLLSVVPVGLYTALTLGINSDNISFLAEDVPSRIALEEFAELFPILNETLLVVIDGDTPELTREAADALEQRLGEVPERLREVYQPGAGRFFDRNGLLYLDLDGLDELAIHLSRLQPVLAELDRDPSIANLSLLVRDVLDHSELDERDRDEWASILDRISHATFSVYSEYPLAVSWEELLLEGSPLDASTRRVLLVEPVLDPSLLLGAGPALSAIREAARELGYTTEQGVRVRITGNPALNHEEMLGLLWDIGIAGIFCFVLVAAIIMRALRSLQLMLAAIVTLLVGLIWTAGFATTAVGHLNLASISFAILFIGLGVDFGIHLGMQYAALRRDGVSHESAMERAARGVGTSLVLCTATTAIGFYSFVPTDYTGVAELGLISGTGMLVILFMTLTLFPALVTHWLPLRTDGAGPGSLEFRPSLLRVLEGRERSVRWVALALAVGGVLLLPSAEFDPNAVAMRDPSTESVQTFDDLLVDNALSSPWFANSVAPDLPAAVALGERFEALDEVSHVLTLQDFVPQDQEDKREILMDLALLLDTVPSTREEEAPSPAEQLDALRALRDFLGANVEDDGSALAASMGQLNQELTRFLKRAEGLEDPTPVLRELESVLLGDFAAHLDRLRLALEPEVVTLESVPRELVRRMRADDGRARVQIYPQENLSEKLALERFADAVTALDPRATGMAVNLVGFGHATVASLKQALATALAAITLLLWLLWRRPTEVVLVLLPLLLGAILTVGAMVLLGISFTFVNVIVIPLILGIGVDSGIHLVHRARNEALGAGALLGTTTARAVFYSAITTMTSFGSLTLSSHLGMRGLGALLVAGLAIILVCNLIVLPALLALRGPGSARR